jgi:hypothetical protein
MTSHPSAAFVDDFARRLRQATFDAVMGHAAVADDSAALTVPRAAQALGPSRLAQAHPAGPVRDEAQALYQRCLQHYRDAVRPQDAAQGFDDVGAAAAHFVAANLLALTGQLPTAASLLQLERQLRRVMHTSSAWTALDATERQAYVEKLALLAVLVGEAAVQAPAQGPDAVAHVQRAARGYLQQLLGLNPDALTLGPKGLMLRDAAASSRAD